MGHSQHDPAAQGRPAWNAGKTVGAKRPLTQKQIWAVRFFLWDIPAVWHRDWERPLMPKPASARVTTI